MLNQLEEEWLEEAGMRLRLRDLGCELERAEDIQSTQSTPKNTGRSRSSTNL